MDNEVFKQCVADATLSELRQMMLHIQRQLNEREKTTDVFEKYVTLHTDFIPEDLETELYNELVGDDLDKTRTTPITTWFGPVPYKYSGHKEHPANPIKPGSAVDKALKLLNSDMSLSHDGCHFSLYPGKECHINAHCDDEPEMDSSAPICNLSIGAERISEIKRKGKYPTRNSAAHSNQMALPSRSLQVMHPGCQENLLHAILPGKSPEENSPRGCLSFRKCYIPPTPTPPTAIDTPPAQSSPSPNTKSAMNTLILGTSITKPLIGDKMGKKGNKCFNVSQGGAKIKDLKHNLLNFQRENNKVIIHKIIISVGTNDVRNIKNISDLEEPLQDLVETTKTIYPGAEMYIQSLLPIKLQHWNCPGNKITVDNVYGFNRLLFKVCKKYNLFYVDLFKSFISQGKPGERSVRHDLYGRDNVHLNSRGISVLARRLIYITNKHSLEFYPTRF